MVQAILLRGKREAGAIFTGLVDWEEKNKHLIVNKIYKDWADVSLLMT